MSGFKLGEELSKRPSSASCGVTQALTDSFTGVGLGRNIEQPLVCFRILDDRSSLSLDSEHHRPLTPLELLHEVAGAAAKRRERLDVLGDVEHSHASIEAPF
jgi:hypothetical protein